ncbi:hypothetical protein AALT_g1423 [Alternaria alternata]|nr:hypothetical protein AALT_g1423 [Alternaria alternata]
MARGSRESRLCGQQKKRNSTARGYVRFSAAAWRGAAVFAAPGFLEPSGQDTTTFLLPPPSPPTAPVTFPAPRTQSKGKSTAHATPSAVISPDHADRAETVVCNGPLRRAQYAIDMAAYYAAETGESTC